MAQGRMNMDKGSRKAPLMIGAGCAIAVMLTLAWWSQGTQHSPVGDVSAAQPASAALIRTPLQPQLEAGGTQQDMRVLVTQQAEAASHLTKHPGGVKPLEGPVTERPAFVSFMEWTMLQAVAKQHPTPERELTRMVNFLRFTKQLEAWEALPRSDSTLSQRELLANQLLQDLPHRVFHGDLSLKDAQDTQAQLLKDAVPDAEQRKVRARLEAERLIKAQPTGRPAPA